MAGRREFLTVSGRELLLDLRVFQKQSPQIDSDRLQFSPVSLFLHLVSYQCIGIVLGQK